MKNAYEKLNLEHQATKDNLKVGSLMSAIEETKESVVQFETQNASATKDKNKKYESIDTESRMEKPLFAITEHDQSLSLMNVDKKGSLH